MFIVIQFANGYSGKKVKDSRVWELDHFVSLINSGGLNARGNNGELRPYAFSNFYISRAGEDRDPTAFKSLKFSELREIFNEFMEEGDFIHDLAKYCKGILDSGYGGGVLTKATATALTKHYNL